MIKFGVQIWLEEFDFKGMKNTWKEIENIGFDSAWIYDHLTPLAGKISNPDLSNRLLEPWTILPSLAAETTNLRLGTIVTSNAYRFPTLLAKIASSVDVMSEGRLEFGIGGGWHLEDYTSYGFNFPNAKIRTERLAESIKLIKLIWERDEVDFEGKYYSFKDMTLYPKPYQKPHPPIWMGGKSKNFLRIVAEHADYCNFANPSLEDCTNRLQILKNHCLNIGRNFDDIGKTWHGDVILVDKESDLKEEVTRYREDFINHEIRETTVEDMIHQNIVGTPEQCVEKIQKYSDLGITYFIPHFPYKPNLRSHRIFIDQVASQFK